MMLGDGKGDWLLLLGPDGESEGRLLNPLGRLDMELK